MITNSPKLHDGQKSDNDRSFLVVATAACLLGGLLMFGLSIHFHWEMVENAKHLKLVSSGTRYLELTKLHPPQYYYVDLKDVETGEMVPYAYMSRYCSKWQEISLGKIYRVDGDKYRDDRNGTVRLVFRGLDKIFCSA